MGNTERGDRGVRKERRREKGRIKNRGKGRIKKKCRQRLKEHLNRSEIKRKRVPKFRKNEGSGTHLIKILNSLCVLASWNGGFSAQSSYMRHPRLQMSDLESYAFSCMSSGDM